MKSKRKKENLNLNLKKLKMKKVNNIKEIKKTTLKDNKLFLKK
jgi:hypothetical protein